ncbi:MAG TPA: hypothetical protein VKV29_14455 [Chthonomonas sp.]|jgi:hypothetical protein|uniref:hypothetical protein n=1 Tax=Chthonomonas sp. TaxID=2282153 RepID=UPI002B4B23AC|nr:hypothetical protein [Chthonomonas sp.]HLH81470.1 hypothetical protein [Chthonomonas sp.]
MPVHVIYLPNNPARCMLLQSIGEEQTRGWLWRSGLLIVFGIIAPFYVPWQVKQRLMRRQQAIARSADIPEGR